MSHLNNDVEKEDENGGGVDGRHGVQRSLGGLLLLAGLVAGVSKMRQRFPALDGEKFEKNKVLLWVR